MSEQARKSEIQTIYGEDGIVRARVIERLEAAIEREDAQTVRDSIRDLHESEIADILEAVAPEKRQDFVSLSGADFNFAALTAVDEAIRVDIIDAMPNRQVGAAVQDLDSDDAVYILEDLNQTEREEILKYIPARARVQLRKCLDYPEESAGRRMQTDFIAVPPSWKIGQAIDYIRAEKNLPQRFSEVFTIDSDFRLLGILPLDILIRARRDERVKDIHDTNAHPVPVETDQEEAAKILEQYDLLSAPVIDEQERLVGVFTIDDAVDVIHHEAGEDIKRLAGVGDEELSDSVPNTARSRFNWLAINLLTALLASWIISLFQATIDQMVALAVLMPLVASMGGNAGTQTMTVAVRALAQGDLDAYNVRQIVRKELLVGLLNGGAFAVLIGCIATFWFGPVWLGIVIALAMIINLFFAAASGIFIPLALDRFGLDPAIASGVFVTTVTDVIGFWAFLGLAAVWFAL